MVRAGSTGENHEQDIVQRRYDRELTEAELDVVAGGNWAGAAVIVAQLTPPRMGPLASQSWQWP
jgi:hypothetical protein